MCKRASGSERFCWATVPVREITVEMLEMRGGGEVEGRAEVRRKGHQVSAAIPFTGTAAPPSETSASRTADVPRRRRPAEPCVDFAIGLLPESHLPAGGEKPNTRNRSSGLLPCCQQEMQATLFSRSYWGYLKQTVSITQNSFPPQRWRLLTCPRRRWSRGAEGRSSKTPFLFQVH